MGDYLAQFLFNPQFVKLVEWLNEWFPKADKIAELKQLAILLSKNVTPFTMKDVNAPGDQSIFMNTMKKDMKFVGKVIARDESVFDKKGGASLSRKLQLHQLYPVIAKLEGKQGVAKREEFWSLFGGTFIIANMINSIPAEIHTLLDEAISTQRNKLIDAKLVTSGSSGGIGDILKGMDIEKEFGPHIDRLMGVGEFDTSVAIEAFTLTLSHQDSPLLKLIPENYRGAVKQAVKSLESTNLRDTIFSELKQTAEKIIDKDPEAKGLVQRIENTYDDREGKDNDAGDAKTNGRELVIEILKFVLKMGLQYGPSIGDNPMEAMAAIASDPDMAGFVKIASSMTGGLVGFTPAKSHDKAITQARRDAELALFG